MQSKTTRGARRLLVSTGVISIVLSDAVPSALAAKAEDTPGKGNPGSVNTETGTTRTLVCHERRVIEVDDDGALAGHTRHRDAILDPESHQVDGECVNEDGKITHGDGGPEDGDQTSDQGGDQLSDPDPEIDVESDAAEKPADVPVPAEAKPVIIISTDSVTRPAVPAAPVVSGPPTTPARPAVAPAVSPDRRPEVLGSVTTRTSGVDASTVTRTGVTALAATGTSATTVLAVLGSVLLLAGLGLQLVARRHTGSAVGA